MLNWLVVGVAVGRIDGLTEILVLVGKIVKGLEDG
jgi:hypothetical protein